MKKRILVLNYERGSKKRFLALFQLLILFGIELFIMFYYFIRFQIDLIIFVDSFRVILGKTVNYDLPRLGTLVLSNSLIGLTLIIAVTTIVFNSKEKINMPLWKWALPTFSFVFAIIFGAIKLLLYTTEGALCGKLEEIGHISFVYFLLGVISIIYWFLSLAYKIHLTKNEK